ncbi:MAG: membrane dipeptidase [Ignavibacteriales bacterium]|nr:membrane dipeptidase [Ignavibacteriales bacterium]
MIKYRNNVNQLKEYFNVGGRLVGIVFTVPDYNKIVMKVIPDSVIIVMYNIYDEILKLNCDFLTSFNPHSLDTSKLNLFITIEGLTESSINKLLDIDTEHYIMVVGIIHNNDTELGNCCYCSKENDMGLTEKGKALIEKLIRNKIIIDVAHTSLNSFRDILKICIEKNGLVLSSHTGLYDLNEHPRNLRNEQIEELKKIDGGIGLIIHQPYISKMPTKKTTIATYFELLEFLVNDMNMKNVFIGSDYCSDIQPIVGVHSLADLPREILHYDKSNLTSQEIQGFTINNLLKIFNKIN